MKLVIASNNQGKIKEIKAILGGHFEEIYSLKDLNLSIEVEEDGDTFQRNAQKKAEEVMKLTGMCALSDDSGLCVDALKGAPGVYSARFSGEHATDEENNRLLLDRLEGVPEQERGAQFVCCIALARPGQPTLFATGKCHGRILEQPAGEGGFGYDPLFYVEEQHGTFAQIPADIKNQISHRYLALKKMERILAYEKQS